jgi:hypothetical protein
MPTDAEQLATIRANTLARIAELTAVRKPSYSVNGQSVSWTQYMADLRATLEWCDSRLAMEEPFEIHSQGIS